MKIGIVGTGAVGGYFGACLSRAGNDVVFLARGQNLQVMKSSGEISIESDQGDFTATGVFTDQYDALADCELILFCVKATATKEVATQLAPIIKNEATILTLQNGVDNEEVLAELFGARRVLSAATYIQANLKAPGVVKQIENPPKLVIGALKPELTKVQEVSELINAAGIICHVSSNIVKIKWKKLLWNVTFNPLSALIETKVGVILDDEGLRRTAERICSEAIAVGRKAGVPLDEINDHQLIMENQSARNHETSMLQDKRNGKPMEIESICGFVVRKGKELGVDTPVLETIYSILKIQEQTQLE